MRKIRRILACGHGTTHPVESTLSRIWCDRCSDMVAWVRWGWTAGYHGVQADG